MTPLTCALCGITDHKVRVGLVEWADPVENQRFSAIPRCEDHDACRRRVEAQGEPWEPAA
jgi:hypothetical protein